MNRRICRPRKQRIKAQQPRLIRKPVKVGASRDCEQIIGIGDIDVLPGREQFAVPDSNAFDRLHNLARKSAIHGAFAQDNMLVRHEQNPTL